MPHAYHDIAFTDDVKDLQKKAGSRESYARFEGTEGQIRDKMGKAEKGFIERQNSFYMATVNSDGWPYVQHRGGHHGFLTATDDNTLIFADYTGNRQYISAGNLHQNKRVSLFLMDYLNKTRLKILGMARVISATDPRLVQTPMPERGIEITVKAVEWNCPKFIPDLYPQEVLKDVVAQLGKQISELEAKLAEKG